MFPEIDFSLYKDKTQVKGFTFRNSDDTYYNFTTSSVVMEYYKNGPDLPAIEIVGSITPSTGKVTFTLPGSSFDVVGPFEYFIVEIKQSLERVPLSRGSIIVEDYVPFSDTIESWLLPELPEGFVLNQNYLSQKIRYWRLFLQSGFSISDSNLNKDSAWPVLVNVLIAKLIAHDVLVVSVRGNVLNILNSNLMGSSSSSSTTVSGGIKSIETGPSKVEFQPAGEIIKDTIKYMSINGADLIGKLTDDICGLARKLTVKVPMCKADKVVKVFEVYKNPDWEHIDITQYGINTVVSKG